MRAFSPHVKGFSLLDAGEGPLPFGPASNKSRRLLGGNFQMMNRALDTLGAPFGDKLPSRVSELAEQFGVQPSPHWPR